MRDSQVPVWKTAHAILLEKRPGGENRGLLTHRCLDPSSRSRAAQPSEGPAGPWGGRKASRCWRGKREPLDVSSGFGTTPGPQLGDPAAFSPASSGSRMEPRLPPSTCTGRGRGRAPCPGGGPGLSRASSLPPPGVTGPSPSFQRHLKV